MSVKTLKFEVTVEEGNKILAALSQMPYGQVVELFQKLQVQAAPQLVEEPKAE
jgi:hypothetical protein